MVTTTEKPKAPREAKQNRLPGMEATALEKAAESFIEIKNEQAELKLERDDMEKQILVEMKKANQQKFVVSHAGENYSFELIKSDESLTCKKETRTPKPDKKEK